ncbi:MAG: restriction endonuclease subunit S [Bacteroidaceae bacterium]|nr:restriction endonuclease subunit S [Bacteroidaceae bacterium]
MIVKLKDVVDRVNNNIDRFNTDIEYYLGKGHGECEEIAITERGNLKKDVGSLGFKFHFAFEPGDSLFFSRSFALRKAGMATYRGICSDSTYILRSKEENILLPNFLPAVLQSDQFWDYCDTHHTGGVNFLINWSTLADYEFDLPPLAEQKVLADKLWAAYRLKESYKKLLAATEEMVKSQFIEMFGTIDEPKVEVKKLIDVVLSSGQYGSNTSATDYQEGKPRYIRITDINDDGSLNDDIKTAEVIEDKYRLIPGDIVFARTGATVGKTYMHEKGNAIYAGYLIKYQMNESKMKPAFMKAFTHSKTYYNWVANSQKVGAQPNISAAQYDNMPVLVPQIEKQEEFLAIYHQADKSGSVLQYMIAC